jgi:hypothetical protein
MTYQIIQIKRSDTAPSDMRGLLDGELGYIKNTNELFIGTGRGNNPVLINTYSATEKTKLAGIASGAEVNQNAFSNIKVGSTTIAADSKTDTIEIVAGSNITLTPDATNDKITIAAKNAAWSDITGKPSTFAPSSHTHTVTYAKSATETGSTTQGGTNAETSITPAGTVSQPTFTGTAHNHTFTGTAHGHTFTGSAHTHTLTPTTTDIYSITSVGSMFTATVSGEVLVLTAGSAPTRSSSAIKAYTGLTIANATQGGTISNTTATGSIGNTTATGTVSKPTFTGTAAKHTHTFTGSAHTHAITLTNTTVTSST